MGLPNPFKWIANAITTTQWEATTERIHYGVISAVDTKENTMSVFLDGRRNTIKKNIAINTSASFGFGIRVVPTIRTVVILLRTSQEFIHLGNLIPHFNKGILDLQEELEEIKKKLPILTETKQGEVFISALGSNSVHLENTGDITIQSSPMAYMKIYKKDKRTAMNSIHYMRLTQKGRSYEYFGKVTKTSVKGELFHPEGIDYDEHRVVLGRRLNPAGSGPDTGDPLYEKHIADTLLDNTGYAPRMYMTKNPAEFVAYYEKLNLGLTPPYTQVVKKVGVNGTVEFEVIANANFANTKVVVNNSADGPVPNQGVIDIGDAPLRLATEEFVTAQFNALVEEFHSLVEWSLAHTHMGNMGAPTPVYPDSLASLTSDFATWQTNYTAWKTTQENPTGVVLTAKLRSE